MGEGLSDGASVHVHCHKIAEDDPFGLVGRSVLIMPDLDPCVMVRRPLSEIELYAECL